MKLWWLNDFSHVGSEKAAVERLAAEEDWFELTSWRVNQYRLSVEGVILVEGTRYPVRLVYPDQFPAVPAWVEPQDATVRWSRHQYGKGGALCLELRPDNWTTAATGADMLRSAYHLLRSENKASEEVPSAHHVGEVQSYDWGKEPILIGSECLERIRTGTAEELKGLRWLAADDVWPIYISDVADRTGARRPPEVDIATWRLPVHVLIARCEPPASVPQNRADLAAALGLDLSPYSENSVVIIVAGEQNVVPYHSLDEESVYARKWVILPEQTGWRSGRAEGASDKSVAIVGLGSIGSKVAEILLRSGINKLVLVDGDVFLPANLERHTLDWRDVGFRKAPAVRRRLLHIAPGAQIEVIDVNLNWQRSAKTHAGQIESVADCNLIVDATGDVPTSLMLGALASENELPFVSATVFEGGLGALIARSHPKYDAPYIAGRAAYIAYCEQQNVQPPPAGVGGYDTLSDSGEPLVADDAAVTIAAAHAGRVILDILDEKIGTTNDAWLLIGYRAEWLFEGHGHIISLNVGTAISKKEPADDSESREFAMVLAKEALDAIKTSS